MSCSKIIKIALICTGCSALGLATILTSITLGVIVHHRDRFKQHHIFSLNIILADFIGVFGFDILLLLTYPLTLSVDEVQYI